MSDEVKRAADELEALTDAMRGYVTDADEREFSARIVQSVPLIEQCSIVDMTTEQLQSTFVARLCQSVGEDLAADAVDMCWEHEPQTIDGVTTCARCGANEEEIVAEQEARLEAAIALGVEPELDYGIDDGPDSEDSDFGPCSDEDDGEEVL